MSSTVKFDTEVSIDLDVQCEKCRNNLSADWDYRQEILEVEPCDHCMNKE